MHTEPVVSWKQCRHVLKASGSPVTWLTHCLLAESTLADNPYDSPRCKHNNLIMPVSSLVDMASACVPRRRRQNSHVDVNVDNPHSTSLLPPCFVKERQRIGRPSHAVTERSPYSLDAANKQWPEPLGRWEESEVRCSEQAMARRFAAKPGYRPAVSLCNNQTSRQYINPSSPCFPSPTQTQHHSISQHYSDPKSSSL
jgi:hypothetical protein